MFEQRLQNRYNFTRYTRFIILHTLTSTKDTNQTYATPNQKENKKKTKHIAPNKTKAI